MQFRCISDILPCQSLSPSRIDSRQPSFTLCLRALISCSLVAVEAYIHSLSQIPLQSRLTGTVAVCVGEDRDEDMC
jgi:hypothetical protein